MTCSTFKKRASESGGFYWGQPLKTEWRNFLARWLMAGLLALFAAWMPSVDAVDFQGCLFLDQNNNGVQDAGEPRQANAVVYLMDKKLMAAGLGGYFTTLTGADGCYYFFGNNASDFTIWIDIPSDMRQVTPVAGEVGQPAFYDLTVTSASQTVKVNFGLAGTTPTEIWSMRDDGVMVSNSDYVMLAKPNKDATEKTEMVVNRVGDTYQGDNKAAQVYVEPNNKDARSRRSSANEFSILVGKNVSNTGEEIALDARANPDGSVSFTDPNYPTVAVTAHPDGTYTGVDSESPTVNVAFDPAGNISATDSDDPTMSLSIDKATGTKTVTDSEYPTTKAGINPDGSYTVTDAEFPNLIATVYANNEYIVQDILNNMVVRIDSQGNYTVIDNQNGVCVVLPNTRSLVGDIWKAIKGVFSAVTRFISKIAGFVANVARFVVKVAQVISAVARVVATLAKVAAVLFPELCPLFCAVASFAEGVARISDIVGNFASRVATIAERIQQGGLGSFWVGQKVKYQTVCQMVPSSESMKKGLREGGNCQTVYSKQVYLLLHGMNSDASTWNDLASKSGLFNKGCPILGTGISSFDANCFRINFNKGSSREGLEKVTGWQHGDGATFDELGSEVNAAISKIVTANPNVMITLVGHSRGGLAARAFLQNSGYSYPLNSKVNGLLTIGTPHQGSPFGRIYQWLVDHTRPAKNCTKTITPVCGGTGVPVCSQPSKVPDYCPEVQEIGKDWDTVDFLKEKSGLDLRSPTINFLATGSNEINKLNAEIGQLPKDIVYAEIVSSEVPFGNLSKDIIRSYQVWPKDEGSLVGRKYFSDAARNYILNGVSKEQKDTVYDGDGIVPVTSQRMSQFPGFPVKAKTSDPLKGVYHIDEPKQWNKIDDALKEMAKAAKLPPVTQCTEAVQECKEVPILASESGVNIFDIVTQLPIFTPQPELR